MSSEAERIEAAAEALLASTFGRIPPLRTEWERMIAARAYIAGATEEAARYARLVEAARELSDCWAEYPSGRLMIARGRGTDAETAIIVLRAALADLQVEQGGGDGG